MIRQQSRDFRDHVVTMRARCDRAGDGASDRSVDDMYVVTRSKQRSQQKQFFQSRGSAKEAANSKSGGGPQSNNHQKSLPQQQPTTAHPPLLNTRHQSHSTHAILSSSSTGSDDGCQHRCSQHGGVNVNCQYHHHYFHLHAGCGCGRSPAGPFNRSDQCLACLQTGAGGNFRSWQTFTSSSPAVPDLNKSCFPQTQSSTFVSGRRETCVIPAPQEPKMLLINHNLQPTFSGRTTNN